MDISIESYMTRIFCDELVITSDNEEIEDIINKMDKSKWKNPNVVIIIQ